MNISDLLQGPLGGSIMKSVAGQFGLNDKQAGDAIGAALPQILGGLEKNAKTKEGAESLNKALESKHDGSLLDSLGGLLGGGNMDSLLKDGSGILGHIFGKDVSKVQSGVAKQAGISTDKAGSILMMLAPIAMALLGKQKKTQKADAGGLGGLLGGLLGGGSSSGGGLMDIVSGALGGGDKGGNPLTDILGKLTK